ncbi:MAG: hypothetical protein IRZ21_08450 [Thermoleophilaceae bacterium]|nr:hypothetical protein [Thermoleophilaceae bacterium]
MGMIAYLVVLALTGLVIGALARLAFPGREAMTIPETILVGIAGNLAAGLVLWALIGRTTGSILLSVAFAAVLVYAIRRARGGTLTQPPQRRVR